MSVDTPHTSRTSTSTSRTMSIAHCSKTINRPPASHGPDDERNNDCHRSVCGLRMESYSLHGDVSQTNRRMK